MVLRQRQTNRNKPISYRIISKNNKTLITLLSNQMTIPRNTKCKPTQLYYWHNATDPDGYFFLSSSAVRPTTLATSARSPRQLSPPPSPCCHFRRSLPPPPEVLPLLLFAPPDGAPPPPPALNPPLVPPCRCKIRWNCSIFHLPNRC